jgi:hypothetical protein
VDDRGERGQCRLVTDSCDIDPDDAHFPYKGETFDVVRRLRRHILRVSKRLGVSPVAVAGSIADEYNIMRSDWKGARLWFDRGLDWALQHPMREFMFDWSVRLGSSSKFFNATRHDIGVGNINVATARSVYDEFRSCYPDDPIDMREFVDDDRTDWKELVDFALTDEGTVVIAALVIKKAQGELAPYLHGRSPEIQDALLVTYYKQGPTRLLGHFKERLALTPGATLKPGEGCRVYHQRTAFLQALGLPASDPGALPLAPSCW